MNQCVFITGTDTEVGKTFVSQALITALIKLSYQVSGFKPIAAGCNMTEQGMVNEDALTLQQASNVSFKYDEINPYALSWPTSPHIAAKQEEVSIDFALLDKTLEKHQSISDIVVVEGAGGWRVPISDDEYLSTWVKQQNLPVIVVVGIRLGCLNHALLTIEAIKNDGLDVVGWVANRVDPNFQYYEENIQFLEKNIMAPKLADMPYLSEQDVTNADQYLNVSNFW